MPGDTSFFKNIYAINLLVYQRRNNDEASIIIVISFLLKKSGLGVAGCGFG